MFTSPLPDREREREREREVESTRFVFLPSYLFIGGLAPKHFIKEELMLLNILRQVHFDSTEKKEERRKRGKRKKERCVEERRRRRRRRKDTTTSQEKMKIEQFAHILLFVNVSGLIVL